MNNETLGALEESINDWKKRAKGEDLGDKECPLCILGRKASGNIYMKCDDCIIKKHVGRTSCHATPYWDWIDSMKQFNTVKQLLCADAEVKFLESFLPKEKESNMKFVIEKGDIVLIDDLSYSFRLEGNKLSEHYNSIYNDTYEVVAINLELPTGKSSNPNNINDTILQEITSGYYIFIQKRFLRLKEDRYCSECGKVK